MLLRIVAGVCLGLFAPVDSGYKAVAPTVFEKVPPRNGTRSRTLRS